MAYDINDEDYVNPYNVEDYRDVLNLAWIWRAYWQVSKRQMVNGYHWYRKQIPIVTPKQVEPHLPSTATTLVNDAADHLSGNDPSFLVKTVRESQRADEDRQRVQTSLNTAFDLLGREDGHPIHRALSIHGGWSGMMCAKLEVKEGWDIKNPNISDIRWVTQDPRSVYPDPGTLGRKAVIVWMQKNVGLIRQQWPDWDGHWFPNAGWEGQFYASPYVDTALTNPSGGFIGERKRLPQPLNDNATVMWIEYWDEKYKCFIANGVPVFRAEYGADLVEHGLGFVPFSIRSSGYSDVRGEADSRFVSMLSTIFSELETEAALITQLKWIVQETAWPVYLAPKDSEGEFDLEPGSINYLENPESIKLVRSLREDAIEPKAILELLNYIKDEIERATYPEVLKGSAPSGIRAGYPIAILSTQAKLKFSAPNDALKEIFKDLAYKTLAVVKNRFKVPVEVIDGYKLKPDDFETYLGRINVKLEPQLPQDLASKLPVLEFLYGSAKFPAMEIIRELGYENPEQLMDLRMAEDLAHDPRVIQLLAEKLATDLDPEAASAVTEVADQNNAMQKMGEVVQQMQGQLQMLTTWMQVQQAQQQVAQLEQTSVNGAPQIPMPGPEGPGGPGPGGPPAPHAGGTPPPVVSGGPGGTNFGQALGAPGPTGGAAEKINPATQLSQIARQMMAAREIGQLGAQEQAYGAPNSEVI